jgi:hypothetical protein
MLQWNLATLPVLPVVKVPQEDLLVVEVLLEEVVILVQYWLFYVLVLKQS